MKTLQIIRKGSMGDLLMLTPAIREYVLCNRFQVDIVIKTIISEVFKNNIYVDHIISGRNRWREADEIINLDGVYEQDFTKHPVDVCCERILGHDKVKNKRLCLNHSSHDRTVVDEWCNKNLSAKKIVVMHMGETWVKINREVWDDVIKYLLPNYNVVVVGKGTEYIPSMDGIIHGDFTIHQLLRLIEFSDLFVGTDSGVAHIASVTETPQLVLYSFVPAKTRKPLWDKKFIGLNIPCSVNLKCITKNKKLVNGEFRGVDCKWHEACSNYDVDTIINAIKELQ